MEIVRPFTELVPSVLVDESPLLYLFFKIKAGFFGEGTSTSFSNMKVTVDMVGRSVGSSCTHNNPIWRHLMISYPQLDSSKLESTISIALSNFQSSHTYSYVKEIYIPPSFFFYEFNDQ